jgi:hypothetical protein
MNPSIKQQISAAIQGLSILAVKMTNRNTGVQNLDVITTNHVAEKTECLLVVSQEHAK